MIRNAFRPFPLTFVALGILFLTPKPVIFADPSLAPGKPGKGAEMNCGARIECVTPGGDPGAVAKAPSDEPGAAALIMEDDTVTCLLQEGETSFVIELPQNVSLDHFTFLNENGAAHGELRIAVSNKKLAATSGDWVNVDGIIPFAHKRLFGVSLIGIEAKFVRLSFHVEKQGRLSARAQYEKSSDVLKAEPAGVSSAQEDFQASAMDAALSSAFARKNAREDVQLKAAEASVGPLTASAR